MLVLVGGRGRGARSYPSSATVSPRAMTRLQQEAGVSNAVRESYSHGMVDDDVLRSQCHNLSYSSSRYPLRRIIASRESAVVCRRVCVGPSRLGRTRPLKTCRGGSSTYGTIGALGELALY